MLEINVEANARNQDGTTSFVVSGIVDVLYLEGGEEPAPEMCGVKRFDDFFGAVGETTISEQKSQAAEREILLMRRNDAVRDESHSGAVISPAPPRSFPKGAKLERAVHFRVCERLVASVAPSQASESAQVRRKFLLKIEAQAILMATLPPRRGDVGRHDRIFQIISDRFFVTPHVCMVQVAEETHNSWPIPK